MLSFLRIKDFALIQSLEMEFKSGLTALTGETGAGKSIILAAVELLMGQRAAADLIRQGAESAVVEALFTLEPGGAIQQRLVKEGFMDQEETELVLRRVVSRQGRNRVQINGQLATVSLLADLGPGLLSVCGQHSHQVLLRPEEHLYLLDAFAGLDQGRLDTTAAVQNVRRLDRQISEIKADLSKREQRREYLVRTVEELESADLDPTEEESLKQERRLLANAEKLAQLGDAAYQGLFAAEEGSVLETLGRVRALLGDLAGLDENASPLAEQVEENFYQLKEAAGDLRDYMARMVFDPGRQDWVESRLAEIQRLVRKYGGDVPAALKALAAAREELGSLEQDDKQMGALEKERAKALTAALDAARALSKARQKSAPGLASVMETELAPLGMSSCRFKVELSPPAGNAISTKDGPLAAFGLEQAEFIIAPNPGEGFRPLARIASGGELSRLLLALRSLVAQSRGAPTQIFDEVDAGIGGAIASAIGGKLDALSQTGQVVCITHLPQIAVWADDHFSVRKQVQKGRTATVVAALDEPERVDELARMLAGAEQESTAGEHARRMLEAARSKKKAGPLKDPARSPMWTIYQIQEKSRLQFIRLCQIQSEHFMKEPG